MIVLGIDPGTAALGYGVIERTGANLRAIDYGCLETESSLPLAARLQLIHALVSDLIELHAPEIVGVERLFFSKNAQTAFAVGQARGVVLLAAAQHRVEIREATPSEVKLAVAGYGNADKEQIQRMVRVVLGMSETPTPDDAADALAVAICTANTERAGRAARDAGSARLDRSSSAPLVSTESPFDRAVREALRRDRAAAARRP